MHISIPQRRDVTAGIAHVFRDRGLRSPTTSTSCLCGPTTPTRIRATRLHTTRITPPTLRRFALGSSSILASPTVQQAMRLTQRIDSVPFLVNVRTLFDSWGFFADLCVCFAVDATGGQPYPDKQPFVTPEFAFFVPVNRYADAVGWIMLNRGVFDVLVHPNTCGWSCAPQDHLLSSLWMGTPWKVKFRLSDAATAAAEALSMAGVANQAPASTPSSTEEPRDWSAHTLCHSSSSANEC